MDHIQRQFEAEMAKLSQEEQAEIADSYKEKTFDKGHLLLSEGMIARDSYHVIKGCIREYEIHDGEEKTTAFYTEEQGAGDYASQSRKIPSSKYLECVEETTVTIYNSELEAEIYRKYPQFEKFCRERADFVIGGMQEELKQYIVKSPTERYLDLIKDRPGLVNRVPQYQLASYLGVKPETLSRIRKKIASGS